ncbi:hypothetical protein SDC9_101295 [bioreactor metagenome]|uniref:Uncharacterized protein n=1 Tax=bioreactor metagenome TaxID=1076179 RepID=A0A645AN97_9ZZZZ
MESLYKLRIMKRYCHYKDKEPEKYFDGFDIVHKEKRIIQREIEDETFTSGYLDYILMKR